MWSASSPIRAIVAVVILLAGCAGTAYFAVSQHYWPPFAMSAMFLIGALLSGRNAIRKLRS